MMINANKHDGKYNFIMLMWLLFSERFYENKSYEKCN